MTPLPDHQRRSIRLAGFDYTLPGAYFITVVSQQRECLFGEIRDDEMTVNDLGQAVWKIWNQIPVHFSNVEIGAFVVMPNHIHGIIQLYESARRGKACLAPTETKPASNFGKPIPNSIPTIVGSFKSAATKRINELRGTPGTPVWQRNYYEHIIRTDHEYAQIEKYILENPLHWLKDEENPSTR